MSNQNAAFDQADPGDGAPRPVSMKLADRAFRRAWWSLALYPVSFVASFVVGEVIFSELTENADHPALWEALLATIPALLIFVTPGILAVIQGRGAMKLGRRDGKVPAILGAIIGIAFIGQNLAAGMVGLVTG